MRHFTIYSLLMLLCVSGFGCKSPDSSLEPSRSLIPTPPIVSASELGRDHDGDGVIDANDRCPGVPEDRDGLMDEDGCPEEDADNDGFLDGDDACPVVSETINGFEDRDGCPDEGRALCNDCQAVKRLVLVVYFEELADELTPDEGNMLVNLADEIMAADPPLEVFVVGHTSDQGDKTAQRDLSRRRAIEVKASLVALGVEEDAIEVSGRGARAPRVPHGAKGSRYLNDRVEVHVR